MPSAGPLRAFKPLDRTYAKRCSDSDVEFLHVDTKTPYNLLLALCLSERSLLG